MGNTKRRKEELRRYKRTVQSILHCERQSLARCMISFNCVDFACCCCSFYLRIFLDSCSKIIHPADQSNSARERNREKKKENIRKIDLNTLYLVQVECMHCIFLLIEQMFVDFGIRWIHILHSYKYIYFKWISFGKCV